jgi:ABC-type nitrate/sulfonate/bicarbonate transport system substrate-binding protein
MRYLRMVLLVLFAAFTGELRAHAAAAPTKMVVAYASISPRVAPLWAAQELGFFKKNGIEAELIFVRGAPTLVAALTSGDMDIGYTAVPPV